jgi:hypothetical protein
MKKIFLIVAIVFSAQIHHAAAQATAVGISANNTTLNSGNIYTYTENFDSIPTSSNSSIATAAPGWSFFRTGASANATFSNPIVITPTYTSGSNTLAVTQNAGTAGTGAVSSASSGGAYLWVSGTLATGTDKSIGFLSAGSYPGTTTYNGQQLALLFGFQNNFGQPITNLDLNWNFERYRMGSRTQSWEFYTSTDGVNWLSNNATNQVYSGTSNAIVYNPPESIAKSVTLSNLDIQDGQNYYLRWSFVTTGSWTNSQGLGIDDVAINATVAPEPTTALLAGGGLLCLYFLLRRRKTP